MQPVKFPVDRFFFANQYQSTCSVNKEKVPIWLMALGQPLEIIRTNIQTNEKAGRQWNGPHTGLRITPLHVAVWRQNLPLINYLLQDKKSDPNVPDVVGFLPIHYAEAIGNNEITQVIRTATKTDYASHTVVWEKLLTRPTVPPDAPVFSYVGESGETVMGNAATFVELTGGATFVPRLFFRSRQVLLEQLAWSLEKSKVPDTSPLELAKITELETNAVPLCLKRQGPAGWGVVSTQTLKPLVPIVLYAGEGVVKEEREKSAAAGDYRVDFIEAHRFRNIGAMINDGFPNCILDEIRHPSGIVYDVIIPIRPIAEGEEIFFDYGSVHDIKRMKRIELNLDEARAFLSPRGLLIICREELLPQLRQRNSTSKNLGQSTWSEMHILMSKISYLLKTPSVLIQLTLEKTIKVAELTSIALDKEYRAIFNDHPHQQEKFRRFVEIFETLEQIDVNPNRNFFKEVWGFLEELSESYNSETVVIAIGLLASILEDQLGPKTLPSEENLAGLFEKFEEAIPAFEITRNCLYQQREVTDEELMELQKIGKGNPRFENLYLLAYAAEDTTSYPKLNQFLAERNKAKIPALGPEGIVAVAEMLRQSAIEGATGMETLLQQFETDPIKQAEMMDYFAQRSRGQNLSK